MLQLHYRSLSPELSPNYNNFASFELTKLNKGEAICGGYVVAWECIQHGAVLYSTVLYIFYDSTMSEKEF